jgi:hypothetical protein
MYSAFSSFEIKQVMHRFYKGMGMITFEKYLEMHKVDPVILSVIAKVRYLTVWKAKTGRPITPESAEKIRQAALRLTGAPYVGSFVLYA